MRSIIRNAAVGALALLSLATEASAQARDYRDIKTPPLRNFTVPQPKRVALPNGMVILLMEDRELPIIRGTARIRGGERDVEAAKTGLVGILAQSWRTGGTATRTGDQLDEFLEARAAIVETGGGIDSTSVSLNVLKNDFDTVFPIFLDLMRNPAFRQEKIELAKTQANTAISRRNDEAADIRSRESAKLGYGADSPYARQPEYSTIAAITRDDLIAFHKRFVHPNNIVFGITGDFDAAAMERKLRSAFSSWPRGPQAPAAPAVGTPAKPGVYLVTKEDVNQSQIAMVHRGIERDNPDYAAVQVLNEILGSERLFPRIRTQQGLAYSVGGGVGSDWDYPGLFRAVVGTKSETTAQAIDSLRKELNAIRTEAIPADELARAKDSILNQYIFTMDSRLKVLTQAMNLEFYGYPRDWYQTYPERVRRVTAEDVARVAKAYIHPDQLSLLVVGKPADFDKPLTSYGTVTPIDITIPELSSTRPAAPAASNPQGEALFEKVRRFAGGKAAVDAVQSVRYVSSMSRQTPQGPMDLETDVLISFPERTRAVMKTPMGEMTMVMTPDTAFMTMPGAGTRDLPASQAAAMRSESKLDLLTILKYPERYTFSAAGNELVVAIDGDSARFIVDDSGKVLRKITRAKPPQQGDQVTEYTDWKSYAGVMFPTGSKITVNGEEVGTSQLRTVELNPAFDANAFVKPAA